MNVDFLLNLFGFRLWFDKFFSWALFFFIHDRNHWSFTLTVFIISLLIFKLLLFFMVLSFFILLLLKSFTILLISLIFIVFFILSLKLFINSNDSIMPFLIIVWNASGILWCWLYLLVTTIDFMYIFT